MNDKPEPNAPQGLEEAPASFGPAAAGACDLRADELRGRDLRGQDLTKVEGLLPEHLAGADLTGAKLPEEITKFPALEQVKAISAEARKIFIGLLAACVYSWLVTGKTHDVDLIVNTASSPLPIINTAIPIAGFYVVGASVLAAVYGYLHFYLQRLWRTLATLPAIFPDGLALDDKTDPWLLTNLVCAEFERLRPNAPPLAHLENLLAVFLAWWLVPITLLALWARYLPAHGWRGTTWLVTLIFVTTVFGQHTYRLTHAALLGRTLPTLEETHRSPSILARAWQELRGLRVGDLTVCLTIALTVISYSGFVLSPRDRWTIPWALNLVGIRTYADLHEVEVAKRPEGWDGKDWNKVKWVDLGGVNLAFADAEGAFLANANLRGADLAGADLSFAHLQGAFLFGAELRGAFLPHAQLQGADLRFAQLQSALTTYTQLDGAWLFGAQLQDAFLFGAELQGADLSGTRLQGANLTRVQLQGADLTQAQLQGANLFEARLQGADLRGAQLQGADLRGAALWRALVPDDEWNLADLRDTTVQPMTKTDIDKVVALITEAIKDESGRKEAVERLTRALESDGRPARPMFPTTWESQPHVMFSKEDPKPEPFRWGPPKWATEEAYDTDLARLLGDLACGRDVPEAQTQVLARRALATSGRVWSASVARQLIGAGGAFVTAEEERVWPALLAKQVIGPDCPPARGLPEGMRRGLEELAGRGDAAAARPETSSRAPNK